MPDQRAGPLAVHGADPQIAVIPAVTRQYSSAVLNFAAHSPEDANTTEVPFCQHGVRGRIFMRAMLYQERSLMPR